MTNHEARKGGRLMVLTGPTAVGKGTVEAALRKEHPEVWVSVSATTRAPRPGEVDGVTYWFMSEDEFEAKERAGEFLETALVHGMAHYGTPLVPVEEIWRRMFPLCSKSTCRARAVSRNARANSASTWSTCSWRRRALTN